MTLQVKTWVPSLSVLILLVSRERKKILLINLARSVLQREINLPTNAFTGDKIKTERDDLPKGDKRTKAERGMVPCLLVQVSLSDSQSCVQLGMVLQRMTPLVTP